MKMSPSIRARILVAAAALLPGVCAFAADPSGGAPQPMAPQGMAPQERRFDWFEHTQQTLGELKAKLNLAPGQTAAWNSWSAGVLADAKQQLTRMKDREEKMGEGPRAWAQGTTPERMARGIERLRAEIERMQAHLTQLEAAQGRTLAFYNQLDANQKTIFDLFWQEVHYRMVDEMETGHAPQ
ncbi:MAG TPA: Spy/CpxP family protein refolding chaperone [Burkholderiaceae bacterium]|nr:Spy/CpxP family protein refolding chaperone [Burkholderiaceae bacterium]